MARVDAARRKARGALPLPASLGIEVRTRSAMFVEQRVLAQDRLILRAQCTLMGVEVINSDVFYFVEPRGCVAMVHQSSDSRKRTPNVEKHKVFVIATTHLVCHHFALPAARRLRISSR